MTTIAAHEAGEQFLSQGTREFKAKILPSSLVGKKKKLSPNENEDITTTFQEN